ncbi:MAG: hypothetical protein ACI4LN_07900, partial [Anaerovoracaceae bacterium]
MKQPGSGPTSGQAAGRQRTDSGPTVGRPVGKQQAASGQKQTERGCPEGQPLSLWLSQIGIFRDYTMPCAIIACATFSK